MIVNEIWIHEALMVAFVVQNKTFFFFLYLHLLFGFVQNLEIQ